MHPNTRFKSLLDRRDFNSAIHHLDQLRAIPLPNQVLGSTLRLRELELQMLQGKIEHGISGFNRAISQLEVEKEDVFQRIKLMTMKARFYQQCNVSQKVLSVALRAASLAYRTRIASVLWEAIEVVGQVLLSMSEFEATIRLLECIIPQVLECEDSELIGGCIATAADAYMGLASQTAEKSEWKTKERMVRALGYLELAESEFAKVGNVKRQCEVLAKKGMILMKCGDQALANDCAARYLLLAKEVRESN